MDDVIFLEYSNTGTRGGVLIGGGKGRLSPLILLKGAESPSEIEAKL